jgi:hypothetical protein
MIVGGKEVGKHALAHILHQYVLNTLHKVRRARVLTLCTTTTATVTIIIIIVVISRFKGVSRHICHKGWMHSDDDDDEEGGSRWWDNKADDDWTVVGPCLEFGDALVHVTTEVATLTPANPSTTDKGNTRTAHAPPHPTPHTHTAS